MPTIGWDESLPSNTSSAALGDDEIRSMKTNIAGGLSTSMYWPGTGGGSAASAGIMVPGAARTFYAAESAVSAAQDGQLMYASDTSRLWYVGTTGPVYLGGQFGLECAANPGAGARWAMASGVTVNGSGTTQAYGVTYVTVPRVVASLQTSLDAGGTVTVQPYASGFSVQAYAADATAYPASTCSIHWMSFGTVAV